MFPPRSMCQLPSPSSLLNTQQLPSPGHSHHLSTQVPGAGAGARATRDRRHQLHTERQLVELRQQVVSTGGPNIFLFLQIFSGGAAGQHDGEPAAGGRPHLAVCVPPAGGAARAGARGAGGHGGWRHLGRKYFLVTSNIFRLRSVTPSWPRSGTPSPC